MMVLGQSRLQHSENHLIMLYRNLLVSYSDTSNIESLEFPFHTQWGRDESSERAGRQSGGREEKAKLNK